MRGERQVDDASLDATCGQAVNTWDECVTVSFNVPRPQRLLLVGSGEWQGQINSTNTGRCMFAGANFEDLGPRSFGEKGTPSPPFNLAMNSVTGVVNKGTYEIGMYCRSGSGRVIVRNTELSVVGIGDG